MDKAILIHQKMDKVNAQYQADLNYANERFTGRVQWLANNAEHLLRFEQFMKKYDGKAKMDYTIEAYHFIKPTLNLAANEGTTWADMNAWIEEFFGEANEVEDHEGTSVNWRRFCYPSFNVDININELCAPVYKVSEEIKKVETRKIVGVQCGDQVVAFGEAPKEPEPDLSPAGLSAQHEDEPRDEEDDLDRAIQAGIDDAERKEIEG